MYANSPTIYAEKTSTAGRNPGSGSLHRLVKRGWRLHASCPWNGIIIVAVVCLRMLLRLGKGRELFFVVVVVVGGGGGVELQMG